MLYFLEAGGGGQTWGLMVFVYFLFQYQRLGPLGYCAPQFLFDFPSEICLAKKRNLIKCRWRIDRFSHSLNESHSRLIKKYGEVFKDTGDEYLTNF